MLHARGWIDASTRAEAARIKKAIEASVGDENYNPKTQNVPPAIERSTGRPKRKVRPAPAEKKSKFKVLAGIPAATKPTPCVARKVPSGAAILKVQRPWIDLILDGRKTWEIRGQRSCKPPQDIFLAPSGEGGIIIGSVKFVRCIGPLSREQWKDAAKHCVGGTALPYGRNTFAWEVKDPVRFPEPAPFANESGPVTWSVY